MMGCACFGLTRDGLGFSWSNGWMLFAAVELNGAAAPDLFPVGRVVFLVATNLIGLWIGVGAPFRAGWRGRPILNAVSKGWVRSILYMIGLCFFAPWVGSLIDEDLGRAMWRSWVPEPPAIFMVAIMGWLLPWASASVGALAEAWRDSSPVNE